MSGMTGMTGIAISPSRVSRRGWAPPPASRRAALLVAAALWAVSGCAGWRGARDKALADRSSSAGSGARVWAFLVAGDDRGAEAAAAAGLAADPHDRLTRLADASLAFERGDS